MYYFVGATVYVELFIVLAKFIESWTQYVMASEATERCFLIVRVSNVLNVLDSIVFYLKKQFTEGSSTYKLPEFLKCTISKLFLNMLLLHLMAKIALVCQTWLNKNKQYFVA